MKKFLAAHWNSRCVGILKNAVGKKERSTINRKGIRKTVKNNFRYRALQ